ncbi:MAG: hypothetical protein LBM70_00990, partial [Victivallales bacterium]|nr:hypothetical protein [Victivallales bacterium]
MRFRFMTIIAAAMILQLHGGEIEYTKGEEFAPVSMDNVAIVPGSALDLSNLIEAPAGKYGRIVASPDGTLFAEQNKGQKFRLFGGNGVPTAMWHGGDDAEFRKNAAEFAVAFRRQGYNCLRLHGIDQKIMTDTGSGKPLQFNAKYLDRWDFLLSEMKKQGCYFQLVIFSFHLYEPTVNHTKAFKDRRLHKLMMYLGRDWERERFRKGAELLLNHVNPYTGMAWKDDPAFAVVEFYNEQYDGLFT